MFGSIGDRSTYREQQAQRMEKLLRMTIAPSTVILQLTEMTVHSGFKWLYGELYALARW